MQAPGGVLLIEWPLPWPADVKDIEDLGDVRGVAAASGVRVLLVRRTHTVESERVVCLYRRRVRPKGAFAGYEPFEVRRPPAHLAAAALDLLAGADGEVEPPASEVVACTHGRRDVCCGSLGTTLYRDIEARLAASSRRSWGSSHQGGHRFAPTALCLPDGTSWGRLHPDLALEISNREVSPSSVIGHYRGSAGLADPRVQALEAIAFASQGWSWLAADRLGAVTKHSVVTVTGTNEADTIVGSWMGIVEKREHSGPSCGKPEETAAYAEWLVQAYERLS